MEDGSSPLFRLLLLIVIIVIKAVVYGFSAAVQNINQSLVQKNADEGSENSRRIIAIIDNPNKFINTVQVTSTFLSMSVGIFELGVVTSILRKYSVHIIGKGIATPIITLSSYIIGAICIIFLILSLGVLIPKKIGAKYPEKWAYSLVNLVYILMIIFTPVTKLITGFVNVLLKPFGIDIKDEEDNLTEEDIVSVVNEGHEQGVLLASEVAMINNIVEFGDKDAKDIMTHRKHLVAVDGDMTLNKAMRFILSENKSRFPIYEDDIDNIVGVLHLKDAAKAYEKPHLKNKKLRDIPNLYRKTLYIPETKKINVLFRIMQSEKIHMVVVLDEYGQTSGIVAMEDILEEIVGNILDEYDEDENNIVKQSDGSYIVKGITSLDDLEKALSVKYDEDDYDTINGFMISKLERIPAEDDRTEIVSGNYKYKILSVENNMISLVHIHQIDNK